MQDTLTPPDAKSVDPAANKTGTANASPVDAADAQRGYEELLTRLKGEQPGDNRAANAGAKAETVIPPASKAKAAQLDPNPEEHPTPHDSQLYASIGRRAQLVGKLGTLDDNDVKEEKRSLDEEIRRQVSIREQWKLSEKEVSKKYDPDIYNLWRPIGWFNHDETAKKDGSYVVNHPQGGKVQITSQALNYHDSAIKDVKAIEAGVLHAKHNWKEDSIVVHGGDENFKAATWAYAQVHGLKVLNYKPEGEHLAYANALILQKQQEMLGRQNAQQPFVDPAAQASSISSGAATRQATAAAAPVDTAAGDSVKKDAAPPKDKTPDAEKPGAGQMPGLDTYRAMQEKDALQRQQFLDLMQQVPDAPSKKQAAHARQALRLLPAAVHAEETAADRKHQERLDRAKVRNAMDPEGKHIRLSTINSAGFTEVVDAWTQMPKDSVVTVDAKGIAKVNVKPSDATQGVSVMPRDWYVNLSKSDIIIDGATGKVIHGEVGHDKQGGQGNPSKKASPVATPPLRISSGPGSVGL